MSKAASSIYEEEAEKIQYWIGQDNDSFFNRLIRTSGSSHQRFSRKCDRITLAKVPSTIDLPQKAPSKNKLTQVKTNSVDLNHCQKHLKSNYLPAEGKHVPNISSTRVVKNWELKGHFYAFKKIKSFAAQKKGGSRAHHFAPISSLKTPPPSSENQEIWEEMIRSKENRLFNIGRGIKYLVD